MFYSSSNVCKNYSNYYSKEFEELSGTSAEVDEECGKHRPAHLQK